MNRKIILLLSLVSSSYFFAQSIEGTVTDLQNKPAPETEVLIIKADTKFSAITDENGMFKIPLKEDGNYILEIIRDGVKTNSENITVKGNSKKNIKLKEVHVEKKIEGVTLTARKKLFERKVDRLVFNVENSVASQGIDAVEALAKTPMVRATDDAISIAGKSNVAVMINDRLLNLNGQELINYLKTIRSDDILKIEVITTPPAKYEAEGKSGLINIILKKNTNLGWNGSLQTSGSYYGGRPATSTRSGTTFNYQGDKLSVTGNLSIGDNYWENRSYNYLTGTTDNNYWKTNSTSSNNYRYKGGGLKGEYKINDKNLVGINYNYSFSNPLEQGESKANIFDKDGYLDVFSDYSNRNRRKVHNASAFYDVKLDSSGSKLSLTANVMLNNSNARNFYNTITSDEVSTFANPISKYRIYSGQADLEKTFGKVKTEAGLKYTKIKNDSEFNFFNIEDDQYILNTKRTNTFFYNEQNYAAYASASFKINDKLDAKAGIRYEYTTLEGISMNDDSSAKIKYGKLFPTAYISYKPNENNAFSLNYSRRISRPYFGNLNPFKFYVSEFEYSTGNPYLLPSFSDNFEFGYVLNNNFNVTLYYNYNKDNWDRIQVVEGKSKYSIVKNFYNQDQAGINISYNYNKLKWMESNIFVNGYYAKTKSYDPTAVAAAAGYSANFNVDNNFFLNKSKTLTLMLGLWSNLPNRDGNTYYYANASVYTGMKLNLMEKKLLINLYVNDLLNTNRNKGIEYYPNYDVEYFNKGITRNIYLSVTYKFGNNNVKGATKEVKFEESSRAGGGN
ncbi:TonB-dependent receptor [Chryseobacterium carnipullorum]|uniref:Outer membrane receptor for ferrienterochelin and colicins n=1 Tax=Chryseobacterium carnipullorum TaxID=1124835 RepID=A0A376DQW2_CHRCU|nr:outer membrane beta-barrel family protein [Chryseobacterium carnipullorum]AZA51334.1 TonB-dependent receptor [Chryseobacterium carnipullorum]AZA67652.1 TonB-dependent receptor [Chryseobacterium carnipullorum]STC93107.1 Outer membrane receptor for ferrienterochelin and colicins [Chryseobacterium carnipullorum]